jgi:Domain of unknown function (DUF4203)
MLPLSYELPAAIGLVLGGAVACFAGYRLFRIVLAIYGFIAGAMIASSMMASSNTIGMLIAALVGGLVGSVLLFFAYFVGIALIGAGLGVFIVHAAWARLSTGEPQWMIVLLFAAIGTVVALVLQRYVIIVSTAFSGAWTMIIGVLAFMTNRGILPRAAASDVWILYPFTPIAGAPWVPIAWIVLGATGMVVQLGVTGPKR